VIDVRHTAVNGTAAAQLTDSDAGTSGLDAGPIREQVGLPRALRRSDQTLK